MKQFGVTSAYVARLSSDRAQGLTINYAKCSENLGERVRWAFQNLSTQYAKLDRLFMPRARRMSAMAKITIPTDLAGMFAACEDAYEQATRDGYAENPTVIAAVSALKSAWKALHVANYNLVMAKGFFPVEIATLRADRACQATRKACINLHAAIQQAAAENHLYNRCLALSRPTSEQLEAALIEALHSESSAA
jgi:hypothetical protein